MYAMDSVPQKCRNTKINENNIHDSRVKRVIDILLSISALIFLFPAVSLILILLFFQDGRPVFYRHKRIGRNGTAFSCWKFRTMRRDADEVLGTLLDTDEAARQEWYERQKLSNDPRIHRLGRFLRMTSLDEVPQFINVLRGEMSIVGPRPIVEEEIARYGDRISCYYSLKPGITGLWQVSGRSETSYEHRVDLDTEYYHTRSLGLDLKIMWRTIGVLLFERNGC
jgi:exopolysaccharide production protein ExoY